MQHSHMASTLKWKQELCLGQDEPYHFCSVNSHNLHLSEKRGRLTEGKEIGSDVFLLSHQKILK